MSVMRAQDRWVLAEKKKRCDDKDGMSVCPSEGPQRKEVRGGNAPPGIRLIFEMCRKRWEEAGECMFGKAFQADIVPGR